MTEDEKGKQRKLIANRYEQIRSLGKGGFSEVFLAFDKQLGREVALKQLYGSIEDDVEFRDQREREIRIHSQLASQHVISLYDSFVFEHCFYLVLELMDHSLGRYTEGVEWQQVGEWTNSCLKGLNDIHARGIIHRDLKPSNIFIDRNGSVRVGDFGVAQAEASVSLAAWTPKYIAPEIILGDQSKVGASSDLYSLGLVIYQLVLGEEGMKAAFPEVYGGVEKLEAINNRWLIWQQNMERQAPSLHSIKPEIPEDFSSWVLKLVEKDPAKRYQKAREALEGLSKVSGLGYKIEPAPPIVVPPLEKDKGTGEKKKPKEEKGEKKSPIPVWGIYLAAGVVVLILILLSLTGKKKGELVLTPSGTENLIVKWEGEEVKPEGKTHTYRLTPKESGSLKIYQDNVLLLDTNLTIEKKEKFPLDLTGYIKPKATVSQALSRVTFALYPEARVSIEGIGDKEGTKPSFELEPGYYRYEVTAEGYQSKNGSFEITASRDKDIPVELEKKVLQRTEPGSKSSRKTAAKKPITTSIQIGDETIKTGTQNNMTDNSQGASLSRIAFILNTDARVVIEGVEEKTGTNVTFALKKGQYHYIISANGYYPKEGYFEVSEYRDKELEIVLSSQSAQIESAPSKTMVGFIGVNYVDREKKIVCGLSRTLVEYQIIGVWPGSPAAQADLRRDDYIIKINENSFHPYELRKLRKGDTVTLTVLRQDKGLLPDCHEYPINVVLDEKDESKIPESAL
jgi:serine/threonine protein kinase